MALIELDNLEQQAVCNGQRETLGDAEFACLGKLLRYPDEALSREELKMAAVADTATMTDRKLDATMQKIAKALIALWPTYPLVRFVFPDSYLYTEKPPKKKPE